MNMEPATAPPGPYAFVGACRPGLLLSGALPDHGERIGSIARAVETALDKIPLASSIQIPAVTDPGECRQVKQLLEERKIRLNISLGRIQEREGISLTGRDGTGRFSAPERLVPFLEQAKACGADAVTVFPGSNLEDPEERLLELGSLEGCLGELAARIQEMEGPRLLVESMDTTVDKKRLLGKTLEAIAMAARIRKRDLPFGLIADTAHMFLNGERVIDGVQMHDMFMEELHLANAITTRGHALYGDRHPPFGEPGFLTETWLAEAFATWRRFNLFKPGSDLVVAAEIGPQPGEASVETLTRGLDTLIRCWERSFEEAPPRGKNLLEDDEPLFPPEEL